MTRRPTAPLLGPGLLTGALARLAEHNPLADAL